MTDRTDERSDGSSDGDAFDPPVDDDPKSGGSDPSRRPPDAGPDADRPDDLRGWIRRFRTADSGPLLYARDLVTSVLIVLVIGATLFAVSGVWPPMVAIESGSMEPNMERGDLVFVVDNERFVPDSAIETGGHTTGVVPADVARANERTKFGGHGDVIVFRPNGNTGRTPVIHRAMLWVEDGENWYDRADPDALGNAEDCSQLEHCPAPHAGFITQGDNELTNDNYDQVTRLSAPIRPEWIVGTAELRVPYLGHIRLILSTVPLAEDPTVVSGASDTDRALVDHDSATASNRTAV